MLSAFLTQSDLSAFGAYDVVNATTVQNENITEETSDDDYLPTFNDYDEEAHTDNTLSTFISEKYRNFKNRKNKKQESEMLEQETPTDVDADSDTPNPNTLKRSYIFHSLNILLDIFCKTKAHIYYEIIFIKTFFFKLFYLIIHFFVDIIRHILIIA